MYNKEKGFGFITLDHGGQDHYFRICNDEIVRGSRVEFDSAPGDPSPTAVNLRVLH